MISTHILDTSHGTPAETVTVKLFQASSNNADETWQEVKTGQTNTDGRFVFDCPRVAGVYKIEFEIEAYYQRRNEKHFFIMAPVIFKIEDTGRNYHVPLLLNPYGYSTYRGS